MQIVAVVGDVGDRERMLSVFREHRPQVVAHAAAHKHVPLMETGATEAVKNNVPGSLTPEEFASRPAALQALPAPSEPQAEGVDQPGVLSL